ncbi:MAG: hypothetical protein U1E11_02460, partial [Dethiobacteria bacterium]|nr:hypothetical protein [Dethiobacteria bacterium]
MKRLLALLLLVLLVTSLAACSGQSTEPSAAQDAASASETDAPSTPEPKVYAPQDIFSNEFNPYGDTKFPDYFNIYAASFRKGSAKLEGKAPYTLSMTASGNTDEAIAFLAALAGLGEDEVLNLTDEYNRGGFCEFQSLNGATFAIRKTNPDDDRYEYVDGCHIDLWINV